MTQLILILPQDRKKYDFSRETPWSKKLHLIELYQIPEADHFLQAAHTVSIKNNTGNLHKRSSYVSHCFVRRQNRLKCSCVATASSRDNWTNRAAYPSWPAWVRCTTELDCSSPNLRFCTLSKHLFTAGNSLFLNLPFSESFSALIMSISEFSSECMSKVLVRSCK